MKRGLRQEITVRYKNLLFKKVPLFVHQLRGGNDDKLRMVRHRPVLKDAQDILVAVCGQHPVKDNHRQVLKVYQIVTKMVPESPLK
jgi:hypothetical protein